MNDEHFRIWLSTVFLILNFACRTSRSSENFTSAFDQNLTDLRLPSLFADHMVIQRNQAIRIWGYAASETPITVSFANTTQQTISIKGRWSLEFPPLPAGGPYELLVKSVSEQIRLDDILIGDVWLISGQSNCYFPLAQTDTATADVPTANNHNLRFFMQQVASSDTSKTDVASGQWTVASPFTAKNFSAVGYYFGQSIQENIGIPIGLIQAAKGETDIQEWTSEHALRAINYDFRQRPEHPPSKLYNAMLAPLTSFGLAGVVWYQGENNSYIKSYYSVLLETFANMIRQNWQLPKLPFIIIQLPNHASPWGPHWPYIREAQLEVSKKLSNSGLVVTIDLGLDHEIHPPNKKPVGLRAARQGLTIAYGKKLLATGPIIRDHKVIGNKIEISFDHVGSGLRQSKPELLGFEIAGSDLHYVPAIAKITQNNSIEVWHDDLNNPQFVRYAWSNTPKISLINSEGLPASPFRTDKSADIP